MVNSDVVAPIPSAITSTDTIEKLGERHNVRTPYLRLRSNRSSQFQVHTARVCSRITVGFPKARTAAKRASSADNPISCCSSSSSSRSDWSSRARSSSRFFHCHHRISALLGRRPHHASHRVRHLLPLRFFDHKLLLAFIRQPVVLELAVAVRRRLPFGHHPPSLLQPMQGGIKRTMLHLQKLIRGPLNMLADLMSVRRPIQKRFQDHHVQRSLQNGTALLRLFRQVCGIAEKFGKSVRRESTSRFCECLLLLT